MVQDTTFAPPTKLDGIDREIAKLRKRRERLDKTRKAICQRLDALRDSRNAEELRQHVGQTVEMIGGPMAEMSSWLKKRGSLISVGRTLAVVDFGDCDGKYHGKWRIPIGSLKPVATEAGGQS